MNDLPTRSLVQYRLRAFHRTSQQLVAVRESSDLDELLDWCRVAAREDPQRQASVPRLPIESHYYTLETIVSLYVEPVERDLSTFGYTVADIGPDAVGARARHAVDAIDEVLYLRSAREAAVPRLKQLQDTGLTSCDPLPGVDDIEQAIGGTLA